MTSTTRAHDGSVVANASAAADREDATSCPQHRHLREKAAEKAFDMSAVRREDARSRDRARRLCARPNAVRRVAAPNDRSGVATAVYQSLPNARDVVRGRRRSTRHAAISSLRFPTRRRQPPLFLTFRKASTIRTYASCYTRGSKSRAVTDLVPGARAVAPGARDHFCSPERECVGPWLPRPRLSIRAGHDR